MSPSRDFTPSMTTSRRGYTYSLSHPSVFYRITLCLGTSVCVRTRRVSRRETPVRMGSGSTWTDPWEPVVPGAWDRGRSKTINNPLSVSSLFLLFFKLVAWIKCLLFCPRFFQVSCFVHDTSLTLRGRTWGSDRWDGETPVSSL